MQLQNVFVFRKTPQSPGWRVKLGDFGVSKRVRDAANTSWHTSIEADCSAPEVLGLLGDYTEEASYASPVDMWSLGYLTHWLLTRNYPLTKFALPRYCRMMDPVPLSELAKKNVSNQAMDFVENLLHLSPADRMTAQEAYNHPWLTLSHREKRPPLDNSVAPYPEQIRRSISGVLSDDPGRHGTTKSLISQRFNNSDRKKERSDNRPTDATSNKSLWISQQAMPVLPNADHQNGHWPGGSPGAQAPEPKATHKEVVSLQKQSEAEMQAPGKAKTQETIQQPSEQREERINRSAYARSKEAAKWPKEQRRDLSPLSEMQIQYGLKLISENGQEGKQPNPAGPVHDLKTMNIAHSIAENRNDTHVQSKGNDEFDDDLMQAQILEWEAEEATLVAEEATLVAEEALLVRQYEEKKLRKKADEIRAQLDREDLAAGTDVKSRVVERNSEEKETHRTAEDKHAHISGSPMVVEAFLKGMVSDYHNETGGLGKVDSKAIELAASSPKSTLDFIRSLGGDQEVDNLYRMPPQPNNATELTLAMLDRVLREISEDRRKLARQDKAQNFNDLRHFSEHFKLSTPTPGDVVPVPTKDPAKREAMLDSHRSQEDTDLQRRLEQFRRIKDAQLESLKDLSQSMKSLEHRTIESPPKQSGAKITASQAPVQE